MVSGHHVNSEQSLKLLMKAGYEAKSKECRNDAAIWIRVCHMFHMSGEGRPDVQVLSGREDSGTMLMSGE